MELIVAVDRHWAIGYQGNLLAHVREDMKNFRKCTTGKTVILGSKTLQTFPGARPLPNRRNLILSRRADYVVPGAEVCHSVAEVLETLGEEKKNAVVIGGAAVYKEFLPYCERAIVTRFDDVFKADAYLCDLSVRPDWECAEKSEWHVSDPETDSRAELRFRFEIWERRIPDEIP